MTFDPNGPSAPEPFSPVPPEPSSVPTSPVVTSPPVVAGSAGLPARRTSSGGRLLNLVLALAAVVAIGGVAFAVGRGTAPVAAAGNGRGNVGGAFPGGSFAPRASGQPGFGRGGFGPLTVDGTVQSVTADTLTITTAAGQTIVIGLGASTTYHTQSPATATDVQVGKSVQVQLDGGQGRPTGSAAPSGPVGTAGSVTVVP